MIHEATKKVAEICEVPLDLIQTSEPLPLPVMIKKEKSSLHDPNRFVEMTLLQILIISSSMNQKIASTIALNVLPSDFIQKDCGRLYATVTEELKKEGKLDWLSLMMHLQKEHLDDLFVEITRKKVQEGKLEEASREVMNKMLIRNWMMRREEIKNKIQTNRQGDEEALNLAKQFDELKLNPPVLKEIT
jgi:replicative DNA helicase